MNSLYLRIVGKKMKKEHYDPVREIVKKKIHD